MADMMMTPEGMAAAMAAQQQMVTAPAGGLDQHQLQQQMSMMMSMVPPFANPDPMSQAYAQAFQSYFQQAQAYQACGMDPAVGLGLGGGAFGAGHGALPAAPPPAAAAAAQPTISVAVDGMKFQYQLTQDDLLKVFSRYGSVTSIQVEEHATSAQITFQDFQCAQTAMSDLNGKVLNGLDGTLRLAWANQAIANQAAAPYSMVPPVPSWPGAGAPTWPAAPGWPGAPTAGGPGADMANMANMLAMGAPGGVQADGSFPGMDGSMCLGGNMPAGSTSPAPGDARTASGHLKGVRKYTCRFLIGIENDKDFQVVRRIIGSKGTNMKRIVRQTETVPGAAGAKLRLRGQGSGYFEGAGQRESLEPLQLCVSCTSSEGYKTAVKLVEELLEGVYAEHRQYCRESGKPELDLHAMPQLVSGGGRGGGPGGSPQADRDDDDGDDGDEGGDGGEGGENGSKREGRRRGRRSRAKKDDAAKVGDERGDPPPKAPPVDEIERFIDARNEARRQCNFAEADRIRQTLHARGVALMDEPGARGKGAEVTTWRYWRE